MGNTGHTVYIGGQGYVRVKEDLVVELLQEWADNHKAMDIYKVAEELREVIISQHETQRESTVNQYKRRR